MPRKKKTIAEPAQPAAEAPAAAREPLGPQQEPFHRTECTRCRFYYLAHYIPDKGDLPRALSGERVTMGFCNRHKKQLCTATDGPCADFAAGSEKPPARIERDGGGEWVVR